MPTREHLQFDLPDSVAGEISQLSVLDDAVVVDVGPPSDYATARTAVFGFDGSLLCTGPEGERFDAYGTDQLWGANLRTRMDASTCEIRDGLRTPEDVHGWTAAQFGASAFVFVEDGRLGRFDVESGELVATSPALGSSGMDVAAQGDELWVTTELSLVRLDDETLEVVSTTALPDEMVNCSTPTFIQTGSEIYVVDDCAGLLLLLDPSSGQGVHAWTVPDDTMSDRNIIATPTDEGIWFVDHEQTSEPYFFDPAERQFERLPIDRTESSAYASWELLVYPGPTG